MTRRRPLRFSGRKHPIWLAVALAVAILVGLTSPGAHARPVMLLLQNLGRDLGALRMQLEQVAAGPWEDGTSSIAFDADVGDGGPRFHRQAMAATLRTAHRNAARLDEHYRGTGDAERLATVQRLVVGLYDIERWLFAMQRAPDGRAAQAAWQNAEAVLRELDQRLTALRSRGVISGQTLEVPAPPSVLRGFSSS